MKEAHPKEYLESMSVDGRVHILHDNEDHRYTLAYIIRHHTNDVVTIDAAGAFCSERDMFCKKTGRTIAMGRLASNCTTKDSPTSRGQNGKGLMLVRGAIVDCPMPKRAEQWRWLDSEVIDMLDVDEFNDVDW